MSGHDTSLTRIDHLRQRFRPAAPSPSILDAPRRLWRFLVLAVKKAGDDDLNQRSAFLAFISLVSLIPLLSIFSVVGARAFANADSETFGEQQAVMLDLLTQVLPYSENELLTWINTFVDNAGKVSGFGFLVFLITAITAFSSIEQTINRIWNVPYKRPFRIRLLSFTLLLFWGPVVISATYSGLFLLRRIELFQRFADSLPAQFLPFLVTLIGLTMLYWLVPYTAVRLGSALGGAFAAAVLLELLRQGFGLYISQAQSVSIIYKGLGLAFFFMISVQLTWWIILLGSEVAYCTQHYSILTRERRRAAAPEGSWLATVALVLLAERFRAGEPITPHELLANRLRLATTELIAVLDPLLEDGLIRETSGDAEGFLLACDPHELRLTRVFELYEGVHWEVLHTLEGGEPKPLEDLRARLADARNQRAKDTVLFDLLRTDEEDGAAPSAQNGNEKDSKNE